MQNEILNGRYRIIKKLGRGGFGETYLASDEWLEDDNRCVVKQLRPNIINKYTLRLFEQEAQVLFKLGNHDQIPQLLALFKQQSKIYLVQEYIEGHDFSEEIQEGKCWDETEVIELLQEILKVLEFVHQNNVIHRDIKPANIMRRSDGKIVLIDFGGVKQLTTQTTAANVSTH
ncbi:MAG: serine/threonine-protein kinase, partial [Rivularia sp. (in: cyanobacteria)]